MNTRCHNRVLAVILAAIFAACYVSPKVHATVADLEALQKANSNLAFQYGFEGSDDSSRLADGSSNGFVLQRVAGGTGDVNNIQFVPGYDAGSQAYQPSFDINLYGTGAGLNTVATNVPVSATVTAEAVLQLDSFVQPADNTTGAYILSARPQPGNGRAYFLRQMNDTSVRITSTFGDTFADVPPVLDYAPNDWYYLAVTADYNSGTNQTTANWYYANLSAGETSLTTVTDSSTFQGLFDGTAQVGVGNFANATQEYMQGRLDSVAMINEVLSAQTLQDHLDALLTAPPACSLAGDFNCNGSVENADLTLLLNNWAAAVPPTPAGWDGPAPTAPAIDNDELTSMLNTWGQTQGTGSSVPEPSAMVLFVLGLAGVATKRRAG